MGYCEWIEAIILVFYFKSKDVLLNVQKYNHKNIAHIFISKAICFCRRSFASSVLGLFSQGLCPTKLNYNQWEVRWEFAADICYKNFREFPNFSEIASTR